MSGQIFAGDIVVQLRFYEGFNEDITPPGVIVSSYYLQKIPGENIIPLFEVIEEKNKLIQIYKLRDIRQIASMDMVLIKGKGETHHQELVLNSRKLALKLVAVPKKNDRFKLEVLQQSPKEKSLLDTEIIMPEKKTAVLGFKDSEEKIYFLAFNRKKDTKGAQRKKIVYPTYPPEAVKKGLEDDVILHLWTEKNGKIKKIKVFTGNPLFVEPVKKKLSQWQLIPPPQKKGSKPSDQFVIVIMFRLKKPEKQSKDTIIKFLKKETTDLINKIKANNEGITMGIICIIPKDKSSSDSF
jgi:hypothetical protein